MSGGVSRVRGLAVDKEPAERLSDDRSPNRAVPIARHLLAPGGLAINGKFLAAGFTGVHRTAAQLIVALDDVLASRPEEARPDTVLLLPPDARVMDGLRAIRTRRVGRTGGQVWEQFVLPWSARGRLLLDFCNLGPLLTREALTMIHDAMFVTSPASYTRAFRWKYRALLPLLARRHRGVMTVSAFSRDELVRLGICDASRCHVVHNGVEHVREAGIDDGCRKALGLTPGRYALALSSTVPRKNLDVLLRAFSTPCSPSRSPAATDGEADPIRLVLYGASTRDDFERAGMTVPRDVVFAGRVDDARLAGLMHSALALCFPSTMEGFGLPPLEAMSLGCPAIVAPCGALPGLCGDAVLYASPSDPSTWRRALASLMDEPALRANYVRRGRERADRYSWSAAAERVLALARDATLAHDGAA